MLGYVHPYVVHIHCISKVGISDSQNLGSALTVMDGFDCQVEIMIFCRGVGSLDLNVVICVLKMFPDLKMCADLFCSSSST